MEKTHGTSLGAKRNSTKVQVVNFEEKYLPSLFHHQEKLGEFFPTKLSSHGKNLCIFSWRRNKLHGCAGNKYCRKNSSNFFRCQEMFDGFFFMQRELQMAITSRKDEEEEKGEEGSRINLLNISTTKSFEKTRKKWKLDLTFSKRFGLPEWNVEKVRKSSSFDTSFHMFTLLVQSRLLFLQSKSTLNLRTSK